MSSGRTWLVALAACGHPATLDARPDAGRPGYANCATLTAPFPQAGASFGTLVAISGDAGILAINEPGVAVGTTTPVSSVHVFARGNIDWEEATELTPANGHYGDGFGGSLALSASGDTLVIGASYESSAATGVNGDADNTQAMLAGAAYVFRGTAGTWAQVAYLKASNTEELDEFGTVAISGDGNTVAVGAIGESSNATGVNGDQTNNLATQSGAVYVFTTDGTTWRQEAYLKASNTDAQDAFGYALALSADGTTLAVGAPEEDTAATGIDAVGCGLHLSAHAGGLGADCVREGVEHACRGALR
jgi:hypothetical protein